ncbi:MAG: PIG-L family deacetylase [Micrococcales bacterium]|nr:PIG-L family deacetylase [Micrococcales bacterium]MCL2668276.1 PIG-L family deacetylase [Micrococcales bacterium]
MGTRATSAGRYLFVHAHPDDETLSSGAGILALRRQGDDVVVVTATRGERGQATAHVPGGTHELVTVRVGERAKALGCLGAVDGGFLGEGNNRADGRPARHYADSGMTWVDETTAGPDPDAPADALSLADLDEVVADIVAAARHWDAGVLVSYDSAGGYGHPDHIRCHDATARAAHTLGTAFAQLVDSGGQTLDVGPDLDRLVAAHHAYASQLTVADDEVTFTHVGGQIDTIATRTHLLRAHPAEDRQPHP